MTRIAKDRQLQPEDRRTMASMQQQGPSARAVALAPGRSPSTITCELVRITMADLPCGSPTAQVASLGRRVAARPPIGKLAFTGVGWGVMGTMLGWMWSLQQTAATLKRVFRDDLERQVPHKTICAALHVQPRGELCKQLLACLRHGRSTRLPCTRGEDRRGRISDMVSIHARPPEVGDRVMSRHWEGDLASPTA